METTELETKRGLTYKDYCLLPEGAPYQLIGGEFVMTPSATPYHQRVSKRLEFLLYQFIEKENGVGEVFDAPLDVYLSDEEVYQPDIIVISKERREIIGDKKIEGAPDFVVEILSPSTAYYDLRHKKRIYAKFGVREYWIIDPIEKSVEIYENKEGEFALISQAREKGKLTSTLWKAFSISLAIFK